jgi:hypothetical protein
MKIIRATLLQIISLSVFVVGYLIPWSSVMAQPSPGSIYSDFIALGSGRSMPLPEGKWKLEAITSYRGERETPPSQNIWTYYFLRNVDPTALIQLINARFGRTPTQWGNSNCNVQTIPYWKNYGSIPSALTVKCSHIDTIRAKQHIDRARLVWEHELDLNGITIANGERATMASIKFFTFREGIQIDYYLNASLGLNVRDPGLDGIKMQSAEKISSWLGEIVDKVSAAYFEKRPLPLTALRLTQDGTVLAGTSTAADTSLADGTARERLRQDIAAKERERTQLDAQLRERERIAGDSQSKEQGGLTQEARVREQQRLVAETAAARERDRLAQAKQAEESRLAKEARDQRERLLAEELRAKEQARLATEAKEKERLEREAREREQARLAQETRDREAQRLANEASERERLAQEARSQEQARQAQAAKEREAQRLAQKEKETADLLKLAQQQEAELARLRAQLAQAEPKAQTQKAVSRVDRSALRALVIGNDAYTHVSKLANAREDAKAMAENLAALGYQVTLKLDANEREMKQTLRTFKSQIEGGDEVVLFFAGHGVQLGAANYLLPVDINGESEEQVKDESIQLQRLLDDMTERKAKFTLALIDACRDNPFKGTGRSLGGRGLAPTTAATGQMVIFSAGAGQQALDRLGPQDKEKNGLFTRIFLKEMQKPGLSVDRVARNVRVEVVALAKSVGHEQVPAIYDQVVGEFFFKR